MTTIRGTRGGQHRSWRATFAVFIFCSLMAASAAGSDQIFFPAVDNVIDKLVQRINAENVRLDISTWYLTEHAISIAIANRFNAGVTVRIIGDRGAIFEIDPNTKAEYYWLAQQGVPIRLRFNPTWYPEIDHWKMAIFVGQNVVEFGSANWATFELAPASANNYDDETALFTDDPTLVNAFKTKFDRMWNDTTTEPESINGGPPYLKDWADACRNEPMGCDFFQQFPNAKPMVINTARLEPDYPMPADLIWGQGPDFNNRLVQEINNEPSSLQFVIYRLTVDNITNALLARSQAGVQMKLIIEPGEYTNRKWPEFWLTHANLDKLWAAGIPIRQRAHQGLTHMKTLVTGAYATNASSNYAGAWQRDHDYFVSSATKSAIYTAIKNRVTTMWNDSSGFVPFQPQPPDAANLATPAQNATGVATNAPLVWNIAAFATDYDVYLGLSPNLTRMANVRAELSNSPPSTYQWTPPAALCTGTTYYWQIVSRTNATPVNPSMAATSPVWSFTTTGANNGCSGLPGSGGGGGGTDNVPAPWTTQDIGNVGVTGNATYASGVFTVRGAGSDIWDAADSFRYVSQPISGDGTIVARVTSVQNTNSSAKAGVMLRQALTAGSAHVILDVTPTGHVEFMTRASSGGQTSFIAGSSQAFPAWLKLTRSGSTVTGSISGDGSTWTTVGTTTLASGASNAGLAVTSHDSSTLNTSVFDSVTVSAGAPPPPPPPPPSSVPPPWTNQDVGQVGTAGSATFSSNVFTVKGAGSDIWGTADAFQFVSQPFNGDGQIVARVTSEQNTDQYAKAGVMLRQTTTAGSAHVILDMRPDGSIEFMQRSAANGNTTYIAGATRAAPVWLRLSRSGSSVTGAISSDGSTWTTVGTATTSITSSAVVGLVVNSHNTGVLNTSTFDNVTVSTGAPPPPPPPVSDVVIYASDVPASARHGSWTPASDPTSPNSLKLVTTDAGVANTSSPLTTPSDFFDVTFNAPAGTPFTIWLRLQALGNSKLNDSIWVQFSDALSGGSTVYPIGSSSGLLVNLATDSTAASLSGWGWQNGAYWLSQPTTVTFAASGTHTLRVQIREDGVELDQIVLSAGPYLNGPPGPPTNDTKIVPKP